MKCLCHFREVIRIHQNGATAQLRSGARKLAYDQDAAFVNLGGAEFLCHQIHSILQRRNQADVGGPIVSQQFLTPKVAVNVVHRHPSGFGEFAIDLADQQLHFTAEVFVVGNLLAAGHNDLHQRDMASLFGKAPQQQPEGFEAFRNSLGVVEAVNTKNESVSR